MRSAGYHEKMIGRTNFGGDQLNLVFNNTIKWPYQPKHSPSYARIERMMTCSYENFVVVHLLTVVQEDLLVVDIQLDHL